MIHRERPQPDSCLDEVLADVLPDCHAAIDAWRAGQARADTKRNVYGRAEPVTDADRQVQQLLAEALSLAWPELPVFGEEDDQIPDPLPDDCVVVDPIDGTLSLMAGSPEFAVAVCEIRGGRPVQAVVDLPAYGVRVSATTTGMAVHGDVGSLPVYRRDAVLVSPRQQARAHCLITRHSPHVRLVPVASASMKMTLVALGNAPAAVYLAGTGGAAPWDYAAAAVIVAAAGGIVRDQHGRNLADTRPTFITAWHAASAHSTIPNLDELTREDT